MKNSKYLKVSEQILRRAYGGGPNQRLPSERRICTMYGVSRTTAKMALNHLKQKNLVTRREGSGTYFSPPSKNVAIRVLIPKKYSSPEMITYFRNEAAVFASRCSKVEIDVEEFDGNLMSAVNSKPGVKILYSPYMGFLASTGVFHPLNEFDDFFEATSSLNTQYSQWYKTPSGGKGCFSMPIGFGAEVFAFNRIKAESLGLDADNGPADWDEVLKWSEVASGGQIPPTMVYASRNYIFPHSYYYTLTGGREFVEEKDGGFDFSFSRGAEWIGFFKSLYSYPLNRKLDSVQGDPLLKGETLFRHDAGTWIVDQGEKLGKSAEISMRQIPPKVRGGASISKISKRELAIIGDLGCTQSQRRLAWEFMKHLACDAESQRRMVKEFSSIAVNKEVFDEQKCSPAWHPFIHALSTGIFSYDNPANFGVMQIIKKYFFDAANGRLPVESACEKIDEMCRLQLEMENEKRSLFV
ncbi:MAG TPA: hypothetical protein DET40_25395 [Lentisphaeria bacterium]|nr:MAG: hypothetical protein A2X45_18570 [Lentisphaerae bacterium GWF2_50_93]HCE46897.1 hypothetical protein [Lentisphaeria bacterium]